MFDEKSHSLKMDKAIEVFSKELSSLRTGRANAAMLDLIRVDVYGQQMPINQIGSITTPEPRIINIQVWDQNNVSLIDAAIQKSELNSSSFYDRVLAIDCKKEIQIERASKRDSSNEEQILKIIQSQASTEERNKIANDVIQNNGTKEDFIENLESIHKKYLTLRL